VRHDVEFFSEGTTCAGWLYPAATNDGAGPAIVMAHGFGGVRGMDLPPFAEHFASAGFTTLLFDYRYFGDSAGTPRQRLSPNAQLEDFRNAITWLSACDGVDPERIGGWGTSFSGAHMLHLAAFEGRFKAVVAQVPAASAWDNVKRFLDAESFASLRRTLAQERSAQYNGEAVSYLPIAAPAGQPCALPDSETYTSLLKAEAETPAFRNRITLLSMEEILTYTPAYTASLIDQTPLLMILADRDTLTPVDLALDAFAQVSSPKELLRLDVAHHGVYEEPALGTAASRAVDWFSKYL